MLQHIAIIFAILQYSNFEGNYLQYTHQSSVITYRSLLYSTNILRVFKICRVPHGSYLDDISQNSTYSTYIVYLVLLHTPPASFRSGGGDKTEIRKAILKNLK